MSGQEQQSGFAGGCDVAETKVHLNLAYPLPICILVSLKFFIQIPFSLFFWGSEARRKAEGNFSSFLRTVHLAKKSEIEIKLIQSLA